MKIILIAAVIIACMFYPFMPGRYDGLSITLSFLSQIFSFIGLLFVPVGVLWFIHELKKKKKGMVKNNKISYYFAVAAAVTAGIVSLVICVSAFLLDNRSLGFIILILCTYAFSKIVQRLRLMKNAGNTTFNPIPLYLICIPIIAALCRFMFIVPATEFSRNYAIRQSESLIQGIEAYHDKNGEYPISLLSVWEDYEPAVSGIKQYHYERNGAAYNLYFEQFTYKLDIHEFVMYNKLGEHQMISHDADLLERPIEDLNRERRYISAKELSTPNWKYFWFD